MIVGVAVDQGKLLADGCHPFFVFAVDTGMVIDTNVSEVVFRGPATLKTGRAICGPRAWVEADYASLDIRRQSA